jgi:hypothetical protein
LSIKIYYVKPSGARQIKINSDNYWVKDKFSGKIKNQPLAGVFF